VSIEVPPRDSRGERCSYKKGGAASDFLIEEIRMETRNTDPYQRQRFASGVKTAAVIVILGAVALMADHTFFIAPHVRTPAALATPSMAAPVSVSVDGFAIPDHLRPTTGDVASPPSTF
jgi:hypothetical protein